MHSLQNSGPRPYEERHALGILVAGRVIHGGRVAGFPWEVLLGTHQAQQGTSTCPAASPPTAPSGVSGS